ncbi:hypothetical protein GCM10025868_27150 [Angustibacter aerolatus]|uniref:Uncharacterized protein n=1 Tax=Angustibacter aerolatus TaxID=1162965 RepID=A0ABQ6JGY0_9ACTN|nr:hypothetical protein GCM10025868_27150 [Angustibacter aerolatus]
MTVPVVVPTGCRARLTATAAAPEAHCWKGSGRKTRLAPAGRAEHLLAEAVGGGGGQQQAGVEALAGDNDALRPEEVGDRRHARADRVAGVDEAAGGRGVTGGGEVRPADDVDRLAHRLVQRPLQRGGRGHCLQAAARAAGARRPLTVDHHVAEARRRRRTPRAPVTRRRRGRSRCRCRS